MLQEPDTSRLRVIPRSTYHHLDWLWLRSKQNIYKLPLDPKNQWKMKEPWVPMVPTNPFFCVLPCQFSRICFHLLDTPTLSSPDCWRRLWTSQTLQKAFWLLDLGGETKKKTPLKGSWWNLAHKFGIKKTVMTCFISSTLSNSPTFLQILPPKTIQNLMVKPLWWKRISSSNLTWAIRTTRPSSQCSCPSDSERMAQTRSDASDAESFSSTHWRGFNGNKNTHHFKTCQKLHTGAQVKHFFRESAMKNCDGPCNTNNPIPSV